MSFILQWMPAAKEMNCVSQGFPDMVETKTITPAGSPMAMEVSRVFLYFISCCFSFLIFVGFVCYWRRQFLLLCAFARSAHKICVASGDSLCGWRAYKAKASKLSHRPGTVSSTSLCRNNCSFIFQEPTQNFFDSLRQP